MSSVILSIHWLRVLSLPTDRTKVYSMRLQIPVFDWRKIKFVDLYPAMELYCHYLGVLASTGVINITGTKMVFEFHFANL